MHVSSKETVKAVLAAMASQSGHKGHVRLVLPDGTWLSNAELSVGELFSDRKAEATKEENEQKSPGAGAVGRAQAAKRTPELQLESGCVKQHKPNGAEPVSAR